MANVLNLVGSLRPDTAMLLQRIADKFNRDVRVQWINDDGSSARFEVIGSRDRFVYSLLQADAATLLPSDSQWCVVLYETSDPNAAFTQLGVTSLEGLGMPTFFRIVTEKAADAAAYGLDGPMRARMLEKRNMMFEMLTRIIDKSK